MRTMWFKALPYAKEEVTLALESGVDGLIVPDEQVKSAQGLARCSVLPQSRVAFISLSRKADEAEAARLSAEKSRGAQDAPGLVVLAAGWEIIPVENLLASSAGVAAEVRTLEEAVLAAGVLERGVDDIVITPEGISSIKAIVDTVKYASPKIRLETATITRIMPAGMGHRVCVDTTSLLRSGQGMLVGNSSAFTFLVNAETERNEYVAARPFRINAGGVHAYTLMEEDRTCYLEELCAGSRVLIADSKGETFVATVGRVKTERRPMLLVRAQINGKNEEKGPQGAVFLQNAETIRLVTPEGRPISIVNLKEGDKVLCHADAAGRHFGMRINEDIREG